MDALTTTNATYSLTSSVVRKLTEAGATVDNLEQADYWEMYQKVRGEYPSLSKFAEAMGEYPSKAEWSRWDRGEIEARRSIRDALRKANGLPIVETVAEIVDKHTQIDAPVFFLGESDKASVVLLVGSVSDWDITMDGDTTSAPTVAVPAGTRAQRTYYRPCLPVELRQRVEASGESVEQLVEYALEMKQREI